MMESSLRNEASDHRFFACYSKRKLQSLALVYNLRDNVLDVPYMASHPNNIRAAINSKDQTQGTGTATMKRLFKTCVKEKKERVELCSLEGSVGFYEKIGFESTRGPEPGKMIMTKEKIETLLKGKRKLTEENSLDQNTKISRSN